MMSLKKDVAKLCEEALSSGRAAFTYATYLRVNLAYQDAPAYRGWALVGVVMDTPMTPMLGDDEGTRAGLAMLCAMIEDHLKHGLKFEFPERATTPPSAPISWLVRSKGGPKTGASATIDGEACERLVRYGKRDGRGEVSTSGWRLRLLRDVPLWRLEIAHIDRPETRESLSTKYYAIGHIQASIERLLQASVHAERPPPPDLPDEPAVGSAEEPSSVEKP